MQNSINNPELLPLVQWLTQTQSPKPWPTLDWVDRHGLPSPYDFLLTQPMMTAGMAQYYQRAPRLLPPLYVIEDDEQSTYSRGIIMMIDDQLSQSTPVELGLIRIQTATLPAALLEDLRAAIIPFGALLSHYQIKVRPAYHHFFSIENTPLLSQHLHSPQKFLFGRTNRLLNEQDQPIADVVEILTGA